MMKNRIIVFLLFGLFICQPLFGQSRTHRQLRIGSRVGGATPGSLLFIDLNKKLAQDNANLFYDDANNRVGIGTAIPLSLLNIEGAAGADGRLTLSTAETTVVSSDKLGQIDFQAPLEADGSDAILVGASIYGEAAAAFDATTNTTDLVFATANSETATEKLRITGARGGLVLGSTEGIDSDQQTIVGVPFDNVFSTHSDRGISTTGAIVSDFGFFRHQTGGDELDGTIMFGLKSRNTEASPAIVVDDDVLFSIFGGGYDGTDYGISGAIRFVIDGDVGGSDDTPGRIEFKTTPDGAGLSIERMRIDRDGNVGINTLLPLSLLNVQGAAGADGRLTLSTAELTVVDGDILGQIDFQAPLESGGTDAIIVGASIWAEADDTFDSDNNDTDLVFATAQTNPAGAPQTATEKMRISGEGNVSVGSSSSSEPFVGLPFDLGFSTHSDKGISGGDFLFDFGFFRHFSGGGAADAPFMAGFKSRGTEASPTIVVDDDALFTIIAGGWDGATYRAAGNIGFFVDETPGSSDMPGRIVFSVTANGTGSETEAMRIDCQRRVGIGLTPTVSMLEVQNGVHFNVGGGDFDTQIKGSTDDNLFYVDAGNDRVGIGNATPNELLTVEGVISFLETTTPTGTTNYGKLYTKATNELFFQDGAGAEHLLHGDAFSNIWFHSVSNATVTISTIDTFTKILSFENIGIQDDVGNATGSASNDEITLSATAGAKYNMAYHASVLADGGASKEMLVVPGIEFAIPLDITNVTDDTITPIVITSVAHGLMNGDMVQIANVLVNTAANGSFVVANKAADTFEIIVIDGTATVGNGDYDEGTPTGDVTIKYPGNLISHRVVSQNDLGVIAAGADIALANSDKVALYVANITDTNNFFITAISLEIFRLGD